MASCLLSTISKTVSGTQVQLCAQRSAKRHTKIYLLSEMITGLLKVQVTKKLSAEPYSHQQLGSSQFCLPKH